MTKIERAKNIKELQKIYGSTIIRVIKAEGAYPLNRKVLSKEINRILKKHTDDILETFQNEQVYTWNVIHKPQGSGQNVIEVNLLYNITVNGKNYRVS